MRRNSGYLVGGGGAVLAFATFLVGLEVSSTTIPVFISRGNTRIGSCAALRFLHSRARALVFG